MRRAKTLSWLLGKIKATNTNAAIIVYYFSINFTKRYTIWTKVLGNTSLL